MRVGRQGLVLGVVAFGLTVGEVRATAATGGGAADVDVDDPKMARVYQAPRVVVPPAARPAKVEPAKVQPPKVETAKTEPPKVEPPKVALPTVVPPKAEVAKLEPAKPAPSKPALVPVAAAPAAPPPAPAPAAAPPSDQNAKPSAPSVDVAARPSAEREAERPPSDRAWPYAPRLKLAYRRFPFARVGAPAGTATTGAPAPESFESVSVDLYPMSWYLRVGLSTQFGWESEKFDRSGDYFIAESASVGFQLPGRFTPFIEALAGAGYMRRVMADLNLPTAYWQVGIDAGVEIYVANRAYFSVAAGYLHPGNLFLMQSSLMSVKTDTWSLKVGVGI